MSKIRNSARGQACMVRIPGHCNFNPETTILAHKNASGWGRKCKDFQGAYCCSACHDIVDGRVCTQYTPEQIKVWFYEGIFRTQELLHDAGLIVTKGSK